jgi:hypothetical protein
MKGGWQEASTSGGQDGQIWEEADRSGGNTNRSRWSPNDLEGGEA